MLCFCKSWLPKRLVRCTSVIKSKRQVPKSGAVAWYLLAFRQHGLNNFCHPSLTSVEIDLVGIGDRLLWCDHGTLWLTSKSTTRKTISVMFSVDRTEFCFRCNRRRFSTVNASWIVLVTMTVPQTFWQFTVCNSRSKVSLRRFPPKPQTTVVKYTRYRQYQCNASREIASLSLALSLSLLLSLHYYYNKVLDHASKFKLLFSYSVNCQTESIDRPWWEPERWKAASSP